MRETKIDFYSEGSPVAGLLRLPADPPAGDGYPGIVQGPGWLGLKDAKLYVPYHEALTQAGMAVLIFDYRGFGDWGGERGTLSPRMQLEDLINAVTYLRTREDIDPHRLGAFGSGGTGGGNAVLLAARDRRISTAVNQLPVADGEDWLRRMRREHEWYEFRARLDEDARTRVISGSGALVHPREEIMVPTPERRASKVKADVDDRIPSLVPLSSAEEIIAYKPVEVADRVRNLLVIAVEDDAVTPTDHAVAIYEAACEPKKLIMQRRTTHYAAYRRHADVVIPEIVAWYRTHLSAGAVQEIASGRISSLKEQA